MENTIQISPFYIIRVTKRTTNENDQGAQDIPELWNHFLSNQIIDKIPNKVDLAVYSMYTDYEKDYTKPYTTLIGCKVSFNTKIKWLFTLVRCYNAGG